MRVELPTGWIMSRVDAVGQVRVGRQLTPDRVSGRFSMPYIRAGNISVDGLDLSDVHEMDFEGEEREIYALQTGDILLAEASGSPSRVGRPALWRGELSPCGFQNTVIRFRPHAVESGYALAVFRHYVLAGIFAEAARGMSILHLGAARLGKLDFPLPPLEEQRRIAIELEAKLSELSQARAALTSALAGTGDQDREILASVAMGRLLASTKKSQRSPKRASSLPDRNPIPASWDWSTVGEAGDLTLGKGLGPSQRGEHERPYLRVANVLDNRIDLSDLKKTMFAKDELERLRLEKGDVLLCDGQSADLVGRAAMYRGELDNLYFQNHLIRFRARETVSPRFALLVFRHYLLSGEFRRIARGSTNIANMSRSRLAALEFPLPPKSEQEELIAEAQRRLDASAEQRAAIEASLADSEEMLAALIEAAVLGRLVPQIAGDESAESLLVRLGPPPRARRVTSRKRTNADREGPEVSVRQQLIDELLHADGPLTVPELCRAMRVDINSVDQIEQLYLELRTLIGHEADIVTNNDIPAVQLASDAT